MNKQPIEKQSTDQFLQVHSIFKTIQGEGPFCGVPCVFVRLTGCNLQCPACDTEYTSNRASMNAQQVVDAVRRHRKDGLVVITGGEPFRQREQLAPLFGLLCDAGYYVQVETNGTLAPTAEIYETDPSRKRGVYIVCSPKTGKLHQSIYDCAAALKYVVDFSRMNWLDGLPMNALDHPANPFPARPPEGWDRPVYVQPMDAKDEDANARNLRVAVESCMKFGYTLQIQVHKIIGVA